MLFHLQVFRYLTDEQGVPLSDEVTSLSPPLDHWRRFMYVESMVGRRLGEVDHFKGGWCCVVLLAITVCRQW